MRGVINSELLMLMRRAGWIAVMCSGVLPGPVDLRAQTCFKGAPPPKCASFFVTEFGVGLNVNQRTPDVYYTAELGRMYHVTASSALGATLLLGVDEESDGRVGVKVRYRRWLTPWLSWDVSPGILLLGQVNKGFGRLPAFTGHTALGVADLASFFTQVEHYATDVGNDRTDVYLGARLGGEPGLAADIIAALAVGVYAALISGVDRQ